MSSVDFVTKYVELDSLFKKYREKKRNESMSLHKQLEKEIVTNIELRKSTVLLESKLQHQKENVAQLERLYRETVSHISEASKKRESELREVASDITARLFGVEQRERECAERAAALELREEELWVSCKGFEKRKAEFEAGLTACKKTMGVELQQGREAVDVAIDCLC
ncbi:hypothetical protein ABB37_00187 [Leptomonas pyrrhocoris]|uniref:Uncharacterized protein n=1 Tax=Leptomonas pyrrhocoris TaxID=157538 RepID=A0A0N0VHP3_LEPPY|nr:hypothetical protein ABB37_00187 [Leptomonas pyrrhocoris]KPA85861.1 hypothetical protein ABB37_00187 [Leptomonas pyrrhocoris]|eukprot:XP_015664300.1 hypothetical protein ABB37_00187 [Leptomonas pyrrhocoris]